MAKTPNKGAYIYAECTASNNTVSADTDVDATGMSITLDPGRYLLGYDLMAQSSRVGSGGTVAFRVRITNNAGVPVLGTSCAARMEGLGTGEAFATGMSRKVEILVEEETTYKVRISANSSSATQVATVTSTGIISGLTDPDNQSRIWALRI